MTLDVEFQSVAAELFGEFADLVKEATFKLGGGVHPVTGVVSTPTKEFVGVIRESFKAYQVDGQAIQAGDFILIAQGVSFVKFQPNVSGLKVEFDGIECAVINAEVDAAGAAWFLHVRAL